MKSKRRRVLEVPPKIKLFIENVRATPLENIEEPLKAFAWEFDKGDYHHWHALFSHFDSFFEKHIKSRKDLQLEDDFLGVDSSFPKEAVLQILRVMRVILENSTNRHFNGSYEQNMSSLLASTDPVVVEASLQTMAAFLKKTVGKCPVRDASLTSRIFSLSQGWGSKEDGLGLLACSVPNGCDACANEIGSTLHFEFYAVDKTFTHTNCAEPSSQGLQIIHLPNVDSYSESDLELLDKLVKEYKVPSSLRFSLLTRLRYARAFSSLPARQQYVWIRLYAFIVLVQASNDSDNLGAFFNNEPEFINELVSLLSYEDSIPEKTRILVILSLAALCHDRSYQPTVLTAVSSGGNRGILPGLMQKTIDSIISDSGKWSVVFAEALLSLVTVLVSSSPGSSALREAGFIPTLLPLLKDTRPKHMHLVSTAVHVLEAFMDYSNPAVVLFRELGGLDETIIRLKHEVSYVECAKKHDEDSQSSRKGKQVMGTASREDSKPQHSDALVSYHRKLLMKALLRAISLGTYAPGSTARIYGPEENLLPQCLSIIFRRAKYFGGGIFSLAATVMSDLIHKDPTCFSVLDAAELPRAFLDAIVGGVLSSAEAVACIPQCLDALCLNNSGLQAVKESNALRCFVKIFTSRTYLRALSGDAPTSLSNGLDELIRHASSLRSSGVDTLIEILSTVSNIGSGAVAPSMESESFLTVVPMETEVEERNSISLCEDKASKTDGSEQMTFDASSNLSAAEVEFFLPECISNVARLLETVLQNADTCRLFIEKKGIDAVLQLFNLPLMPSYVSIGQYVAAAFKNFSPQHSASLSHAVCSFLREHLKLLIGLLGSVGDAKLIMLEDSMQIKVLRTLSSLEGLLSLSNTLLKGITTMVSELGSSDAEILKDLGKVYKEISWQISLITDTDKKDNDNETVSGDAALSNVSGRESDDDTNPVLGYRDPFPARSGSASHWNADHEFLSGASSVEGAHRHGRHGLLRTRGSRTSRHIDLIHIDSDVSTNIPEASLMQDMKKKSPAVLVSELLNKLCVTIRAFHATLVKGFINRRRSDHGSLSPACKSLAAALAKLFLEALSYSGHSTAGLEMSLSVKCQYLGRVVDDMVTLIFDSRKRSCNTAIVNSFYVNGTFKELLTTFEATSQLLWTLPYSIPTPGHVAGRADGTNRLSHSSWLLDTLRSYCRLLEYFVNSSFLLSSSGQSQSQLLVQSAASGLSIGLFPMPREPEAFVQMLQSQVLDVILPVWNHPLFPTCSQSLISSVISIITFIYSGVGDLKRRHVGSVGTAGHRLSIPSLDESSVSSIVEMGFTRARAEEALRSIGTNSVEMAMDWLFSHPEEYVQEDVQLAQALELSLGGSCNMSKEDNNAKGNDSFAMERGTEALPVDDILSASVKLFQSGDAIAFPLTDLLVTLCNRNKGEDRPKVALFLIEQLKIYPGSSGDTVALSQISHVLVLLLSEDSHARQIAAENRIVTAAIDILTNLDLNGVRDDESVSKCSSTLLLILDNMMQSKLKISAENTEGNLSGSLFDSPEDGLLLPANASDTDDQSGAKGHEETGNVLEKILGKSTGYLSLEEGRRALSISCECIKMNVPAIVMRAALQLCARLTKTHTLAMQFLENGGLTALLDIPTSCFFPGFDKLASAIIRHLLEDPQTLQTAMEFEIRQTLVGNLSRHAGRLSPRLFLTSLAPVISRDPTIFMKAAAAVCRLESSGGRMNIALSKEKEKDKEKLKSSTADCGLQSNGCIRMLETRCSETLGKCPKGPKKVPASLSQVIGQLLEIVTSYPSPGKLEESASSFNAMDVDGPHTKQKGKSKIDETAKADGDIVSEKSTRLVKVSFILKLLSDILLMYVHAAGIVLKRDLEASQLHGLAQADDITPGGIVHHVLYHLLPLPTDKTDETSDEWMGKLSEKASCFLVVLCGRSGEGRRRVVGEIVKNFSSFTTSDSNSFSCSLVPNKKVLALADLVYAILSKNSSSSSLLGSGCSPDIAKTMIDGGIVQSLTNMLRIVDLDHPDAPRTINLILKSLEILTRAANASDQLFNLDGNKNKLIDASDRAENETNVVPVLEVDNTLNMNSEPDVTDATHTEENQVQISLDPRELNTNSDNHMEQDPRETEDTAAAGPDVVHGSEYMHEEVDERDVLHSTNGVGMTIRDERRTDDGMVDEDDDMGEEEEEDEDIAEEGAGLMSLADTDAEDHEENGLVDGYSDMVDEDDDDFHYNRAIEVRWREGLDGLDQLRVLRGAEDSSRFIDIATDPFRGVNADDIFHLRRPLNNERRRQSGRSFLDRSGMDGRAFQHPLLIRPSQSGDPNASSWHSVGNTSRDLDALSVGNFDLGHFYMFDNGLQSDYSRASLFGDRLVGAVPPPLMDFSLGMDPLHVGGRRGPGDSQWTDDGQPQPGGQAAAIAQAVEDQFVSQLRSMIPADKSPVERVYDVSARQEKQQQDESAPLSINNNQHLEKQDNVSAQQREGQHEQMMVSEHQEGSLAAQCDLSLPDDSHGRTVVESNVGEEGGSVEVPDSTSIIPEFVTNACSDTKNMHIGEGVSSLDGLLETIGPPDAASCGLQSLDIQMPDRSQTPVNPEDSGLNEGCIHEGSRNECNLSSQAVIHSGLVLPEISDGHAGPVDMNTDDMYCADLNSNQAESSLPSPNEDDLHARQSTEAPPKEASQVDATDINNEGSSANLIDPTFLEALPEDLRAEVLASQQSSQEVQPVPNASYVPAAPEEIDPEFLAALPPDIQAEVLAQQRAQRFAQSQQAEGPVDMDNASILATFPPDLREEVLLTSTDAVLSSLPSSFLAEAQILRDRAASHYHAHSSLFGGSHRLGGRRLAVDRQSVIDRGVGITIGRRLVPTIANNLKVRELEGVPLMDANALKALIRLLRLAQPLGKGLLQRLMLNLCAHSATRATLVRLLLDMIKPEAEDFVSVSTRANSQRLFGCQWNVVYGQSQPLDTMTCPPPLVSRRVLEHMSYLATNHLSVANLLFYFDPSLDLESLTTNQPEENSLKGKEKMADAINVPESSQNERIPLLLFLRLLNKPLFLRSNAHLEQVMGLLQVVINNAVSRVDYQPYTGLASGSSNFMPESTSQVDDRGCDTQTDAADQSNIKEMTKRLSAEVPCPSGRRSPNPYDVLLGFPERDLRYLSNLLAHEGLSDKVYSLAAEVVRKLAFVAPPHRNFFYAELAGLARGLSSSAVSELTTLRCTGMVGLSAGSMAGAAILRVLQTLSALTSATDENNGQDLDAEQQEQTILSDLNAALEPLWQELSDCISTTETKLGHSSSISSPLVDTYSGDLIGGSNASSPPLPPGTQRLLPFIEAFFVLCEKLQSQFILLADANATAREVKESAGGLPSPSLKCGGPGTPIFARVVEKHRRLLNAFIRQNPGLLEKSLSMMLKVPRLIDFDNKRAYFRSRIRQQHDQHPSAPLRISVRRAYVLEDSYNQLRLRTTEDLKGRLTVQFQGEEGIDAGGLTREWYQLLSRVIFDKGALLFTTVGNNATFQPNPNSVYQTEHLSYFKFVGRVVAKALFDGQLLDVYFTRSFYKHILGVKVTYHDIEAVDPDYYKNLKWMLENDVSEIPDLTFSMDADEEKHILYEKTEVTDYELKPGGRNIRVTEETKHEYVDLVADHILSTAIRPQINSFLEGFNELIPRELISIFNDKELELLISGLPEIDLIDLKGNTEYTGYTAASSVIQWFWEVVKAFSKEDMARFLQFVTGTSKVPLEGFKALQGISGPQRFQVHKAYGAPERLPSAHTCFNQLDLPEYSAKKQLEERLLLAIHEASEGFGFG